MFHCAPGTMVVIGDSKMTKANLSLILRELT